MDAWGFAVGLAAGLATLSGGWAALRALAGPAARALQGTRDALRDVPLLREELAALREEGREALADHERRDVARFEACSDTLREHWDVLGEVRDGMRDVRRDLRWLCRLNGGPVDHEEGE